MPRIVVIAGSVRSAAETHRIGEIVTAKLGARDGVEADLLSLRDVSIPLWSEEKGAEDAAPEDSFWRRAWPALSARLASADGFVVMTPEHHGMATPHLKNLLFCCDAGELAFKPAYLITVSTSVGGAYPIAELRMSGYKNNYLHWLPDHLIIRRSAGFRPGEDGHDAPEWLEPRMDHGLSILCATADALKPVRTDVVRLDLLRTGM